MRFGVYIMLWLGVQLSFATVAQSSESEEYDYIIVGGTVVDGSGGAPYKADVAIKDGKIKDIGQLDNAKAAKRIDAKGRVIIPGFIDVHGHADDQQGHWRGMRSPDPVRRSAIASVSQGITTSVANSDGLSPFMPLKDQVAEVEKQDFGLNLAYMAAHARIRYAVMGENTKRPANSEEIKQMHKLIRADMDAGAWGIATVLEVGDGQWTTTEELIGMIGVLKPYDGVFVAHPRSQQNDPWGWEPSQNKGRAKEAYPLKMNMFEGSEELIEVAEKTGVRVSISHIAMSGPDTSHHVANTVKAVDAARERGVKIFADMHSYGPSQVGVYNPLIPYWALTGRSFTSVTFHGPAKKSRKKVKYKEVLKKYLKDLEKVKDIHLDVQYNIELAGGANEIYVTHYPDQSYIGRNLVELADMRGVTPVELVVLLALEGDPNLIGGFVGFAPYRTEANIDMFIKSPWVTGDTDGYTSMPGDPGFLNPRFYASFPNWIKTYVIEKKIVSLEFAVRSLTGLAAEVVGLKDRGLIKEGFAADLLVLDLEELAPRSTFYDVHQTSKGFDYVFINGVPVVAKSKLTRALPGKVLKRTD